MVHGTLATMLTDISEILPDPKSVTVAFPERQKGVVGEEKSLGFQVGHT